MSMHIVYTVIVFLFNSSLIITFMQMFDGFNNHIAEGTSVLINTEGYCIEDWMGVNRKVDSIL